MFKVVMLVLVVSIVCLLFNNLGVFVDILFLIGKF